MAVVNEQELTLVYIQIAEALGAKGIPETFFIARDGRIAKKITSTIHYAELAAGIEEIL